MPHFGRVGGDTHDQRRDTDGGRLGQSGVNDGQRRDDEYSRFGDGHLQLEQHPLVDGRPDLHDLGQLGRHDRQRIGHEQHVGDGRRLQRDILQRDLDDHRYDDRRIDHDLDSSEHRHDQQLYHEGRTTLVLCVWQ